MCRHHRRLHNLVLARTGVGTVSPGVGEIIRPYLPHSVRYYYCQFYFVISPALIPSSMIFAHRLVVLTLFNRACTVDPVRLFSRDLQIHNRLPNMVLCSIAAFYYDGVVLQFPDHQLQNVEHCSGWFPYPVGLISSPQGATNSLATPYFQKRLQQPVLVSISFFPMLPWCYIAFFFFSPLFFWCLKGTFHAEQGQHWQSWLLRVNLSLAAYLVNFNNPDPILTGALSGIAITMTLLIYLCYIRLMRWSFNLNIRCHLPSVISATPCIV